MDNYLRICELEKRLFKATESTSIREPKCRKERIDGSYYIKIKLILPDENGLPVLFEKNFYDEKEFEDFIVCLERLKIVASSKKHNVQIVSDTNYFTIYVDGEETKPESLEYYAKDSEYKVRSDITALMGDLSAPLSETATTYRRINDENDNIKRCEDLIHEVQQADPVTAKKIVNKRTPIGAYASITSYSDAYIIDLEKIATLEHQRKEGSKTSTEALKVEMKNIQRVLESGKRVEFNFYKVIDKLNYEDFLAIKHFLIKLSEVVKKIQAKGIMTLGDRKEYFKHLQSSINKAVETPKTAVDEIKSIETKRSYETLSYLITTEDVGHSYGEFGTYDQGSFNREMDNSAKVFADIQREQNEKLTQDEKDAVIIYKSILYRPINKVISFLRENNLTLQEALTMPEIKEQIIEMIAEKYDEYIKRKQQMEESPFRFLDRNRGKNPPSIERIFSKFTNGTPTKHEWTILTLNAIPILERALSKVTTKEDIVVYRGTTGISLEEDKRFISTSLSLYIARKFSTNEERKKNPNGIPTICQIVIPKGSPLIIFSDDFYTDRYVEGQVFNDEQREIIIDPIHYQFKSKYIRCGANQHGLATRINYEAIPLEPELTLEDKPTL